MRGNRPDHFAHLRGDTPEAEPPEGAPVVSPELIRWLEDHFQPYIPQAALNGLDSLIHQATLAAAYAGRESVISYLKTLVRSA